MAMILIAFLMAAMGLKLIFNKNAEVAGESCHLDETPAGDGTACTNCQVQEIVNCKEKPALSQ
ncbi:MAG TPA: hypothetical protein ENH02_07695 [Bacteroidetes bacterium]|nr:hypothetical protein [Bacteroidota bacterium]